MRSEEVFYNFHMWIRTLSIKITKSFTMDTSWTNCFVTLHLLHQV